MTTRNLQTKLYFDGGWATDFGPTAKAAVQRDGSLMVPYLVDGENCQYDLDGGPAKIGGTQRINAVALNVNGTNVRGLVDFWVLGTGSTHTQHRVVHVGEGIRADAGNGVFSNILGAAGVRSTTSVPNYAIFQDTLILMSDAQTEVPLKWSGSGSVATLGTNTPDCAFGIPHKNRFFMAGDLTQKSRLYYSEPLPNGADGDWNAVEAGYIDVDPDDGDEIRALASHKGILWIFKGPYHGSIHVLKGDTPLGGVTAFAAATQPVPFELDIFVRGLGAASQNSVFRFRDDIGFIDAKTGSVRSLNATDQFGDFREAALSFPINDYLLERVNKAVIKKAWAAQDVSKGGVAISLSTDTATENNTVLWMDYRFDPPRWSLWPAIEATCVASVIDTTRGNRQSIFLGDSSGWVRRTDTPNRSIDAATTIPYKVTLPFLDFSAPIAMKTFARGSVGIQPQGEYNGTFSWTRDNNAQQSTTFSQGGGDVLAGTGDEGSFASVSSGGAGYIIVEAAGHAVTAGNIIDLAGGTIYDGTYTVASIIGAFIVLPGTFAGTASGTYTAANVANYFVLGTSTLGGAQFVDRFFELEEGGEFRTIQFQITQNGLNQDIEVHNLYAEIEIGADSTEN